MQKLHYKKGTLGQWAGACYAEQVRVANIQELELMESERLQTSEAASSRCCYVLANAKQETIAAPGLGLAFFFSLFH